MLMQYIDYQTPPACGHPLKRGTGKPFLTSLLTSIVTSYLTPILSSDFLKKDARLRVPMAGRDSPLLREPGGLAEAMNVNAIY